MCIGEDFTVRRRQNHARRYDQDELYYRPRRRPEPAYQTYPLVYQQPCLREAMAQRFPADIQLGGAHAPRSHHRSFGFRMPFAKKSAELRQDHCAQRWCSSRDSPSDRAAGYPDNIELECRSPRQSPPTVRRVSPQETFSIAPGKLETQGRDSLFRGRITGSPPPKSRPRRERTPSRERIHLRRRSSAPVQGVEVHSHRPVLRQKSVQERARGSRQVRFVKEVDDDVDRKTRRIFDAPARPHCTRREFHRSGSFAGNDDEYDVTLGSSRLSRPRTRNPRLQPHTREDREPRNRMNDAPRIRPQIIQDGRRHLSETGVRICMAGRASRPRQGQRSPHVEPIEPSRCATNDFGAFDSDQRTHHSRSHRQPYRRSRWR